MDLRFENMRRVAIENVSVPLNCHQCGGPIEIAFEKSPTSEPQTVRFLCPYCQWPREYQAPGPVIWVAMRQAGDGPETKQ